MPLTRVPRAMVPEAPTLALLRRHALGVLLIVATACTWGTRPSSFLPALGPAGAMVTVRVRGERDYRGELFACDSTGVTIRAGRLVHIAWPRLEAMDVAQLAGMGDILPGETVTAEKRGRLALVSRFPQGLHGELLARALAALHQEALEEIN